MLRKRRNDPIDRMNNSGLPRLTACPAQAAARHLAMAFGVASMAGLISVADAATPVWQGAPVHYAVHGAPLSDVLRDVLAVEGMSVDIGRGVKGAVNGRFDDTPGNVFTQLVEAYGLVWYFDGKVMHIGTASDVRSRVIPFAPMTREAVAVLLRNLDLDDARLPVRYSATTVRVAGPSKFVDAVAEAIDKAQRQATVEPSYDETAIRVFPLRYAQAQDIHYTVGAQEQTMPGVASLLRRLMSDTWKSAAPLALRSRADTRADVRADARAARGGPPPLPGLLGLGLGGAPVPLPGNDADSSTESDPDSAAATAQPAATQARRNIVADQRTNSVVISDLVSMMPNYERAIAMLDQPQELVEIDAVVIDVASNASRTLGVRWGGADGRINVASGAAAAPSGFGAPDLLMPASAMAGLNLATLVGNSARYLFAQIQALEAAGQARVLSRPQVLTLNNMEAALTSRSSVYVRVAGNEAVDLFNIDTGLTLKVTPGVESGGDPRRNIRLNIQIEDGAFSSAMVVDGIPKVDRHSVVTQAIVRDGDSLLIGGYQYERSESSTSKVPVLGDVPYLGALFRDTETRRERLERLIVITPRIKRIPDDAAQFRAADDGTATEIDASLHALVRPAVTLASPMPVTLPAMAAPVGASTPAPSPSPSPSPSPDATTPAPRPAIRDALLPVHSMPWERRYDR
ncbi:type III secretion system outer membrane ring subunit SctC [Paraburkholderia sp.]|uniref:type III secretion system outer membrane ring subunit SctC n=1 Tax=Paraburkholderia sp. TaxID=1926495 RepID=UPI002387C138|nr:type III secretion system outer membrane ring subunit SctC [Paraburkholderia sp.]MDE1184502.1 type III secretion system outer membrane ring subunit SctC [Paraburkholderia sp.]